jgi:hypothetical protein
MITCESVRVEVPLEISKEFSGIVTFSVRLVFKVYYMLFGVAACPIELHVTFTLCLFARFPENLDCCFIGVEYIPGQQLPF